MNVLVLSESFIIRKALYGFFAKGYKDYNVELFSNIQEVKEVDFKQEDLIFIDGNLEFINNLMKIRRVHTNLKIVVIDRHKKIEVFKTVFENNIDGYISDVIEEEDLVYVIRRVIRNKKYYDIDLLMEAISLKKIEEKSYNIEDLLTKRERQVFYMVKKGCTNKQISEKLYITEHTVKKHIANIFEKLHVKNRRDLMLYKTYNIKHEIDNII